MDLRVSDTRHQAAVAPRTHPHSGFQTASAARHGTPVTAASGGDPSLARRGSNAIDDGPHQAAVSSFGCAYAVPAGTAR
jgi:hypothetical protein